jgi:hypothetical protein
VSDLKRLRRACEQQLRGLRIPSPFNLEAFADEVQARRGRRRLQILPLPIPASSVSPYGVWIATRTGEDFILHEPHTTALHRAQIVLHELGHMLFDHRPDAVLDEEAIKVMLPDLDPGVVTSVLSRHELHGRQAEQEAEMLASVVLERAGYAPAPSLNEDDVLARIGDALGHPLRRRERGA